MQDFSDNDLVKAYLAGETEALDELVRRYFRQVFLFAKGYVKTDQEAEDAAQETFVKLWKNIKKFDPEKKFKTWLLQITKNTCIDFLRKHKHLVLAETLDEQQMTMEMESLVDKNPLPEQLFDSQGFNEKLDTVIANLPKLHNQVVSLHLQHDLTFQEIADILGEPINTIKSRYRRALLDIQEQFRARS